MWLSRVARSLPGMPLTLFSLACGSLIGCTAGVHDSTTDTDTASTVAGVLSPTLLAEDLEGGALLSAWSDGDDLLMVGGVLGGGAGLLVRYDGAGLCTEAGVTDHALWWVHGTGPGTWWAVGEEGVILHSQDGVRTREDVPTEVTLYGVYATSERVVAVGGLWDTDGERGEVWVREDGSWRLLAETDDAVFKAWEGWLVGDGAAWRLEGDDLIPVDLGGRRLLTVRGADPDSDVWAVGGLSSPDVVRYDGTDWEPVDTSVLYQPLNGVWTAPDEPVWVAGNFGTAARWTADDGWAQPEAVLTSDHFHAVWKHGDEVIWVGGNLFSSPPQHGVIASLGGPQGPLEISTCP